MFAEIISIGDELLIGQVVNTNASWMAARLNDAGIRVKQISAISDERGLIFNALNEALLRADIILLTGGLGPTKDDITKSVLAEYFNVELIFNEDVFENIKNIFGKHGRTISDINRDQALIPANAKPIDNNFGTAPGMWFERDDKIIVSMPGVPYEMKAMMEHYIIPELQKRFTMGAIFHKTVLTTGIGESALAEKIESWESNLPDNIKLAYLPKPGIVRLRLSAFGKATDQLEKTINREIQKLLLLIPEFIFGYEDDTLEKKLVIF
ncbi:MAG: molybdopterin-binding protein [Bacteroidales bacterium]